MTIDATGVHPPIAANCLDSSGQFDLKLERLIEILQDAVNGSVDPIDAVVRFGSGFFRFVSQVL